MHAETLKGREFERVFNEGEKISSRNITAFVLKVKTKAKCGIVVTKKHGKACARNRLKRRVKEAIRVLMPQIQNIEAVLIPRAGINKIDITDIVNELSTLIPGCRK